MIPTCCSHSIPTGYRVGRVRLIFALPPHLQRLRADPMARECHLAYIELFTPFLPVPEPGSRLYRIARSFRNHAPRSIVIPVPRIFRSCHLLPVCEGPVDRTWTSDNVLDRCTDFYLNTFIDRAFCGTQWSDRFGDAYQQPWHSLPPLQSLGLSV